MYITRTVGGFLCQHTGICAMLNAYKRIPLTHLPNVVHGANHKVLSLQDLLHKLFETSNLDTFSTLFAENLGQLFECEQTEVIELLCDSDNPNGNTDKLVTLRLDLFNMVIDILPQYHTSRICNRRKVQFLADGIYILGYSVINRSIDKS